MRHDGRRAIQAPPVKSGRAKTPRQGKARQSEAGLGRATFGGNSSKESTELGNYAADRASSSRGSSTGRNVPGIFLFPWNVVRVVSNRLAVGMVMTMRLTRFKEISSCPGGSLQDRLVSFNHDHNQSRAGLPGQIEVSPGIRDARCLSHCQRGSSRRFVVKSSLASSALCRVELPETWQLHDA